MINKAAFGSVFHHRQFATSSNYYLNVAVPMPVPAGAISLEKSSRAFFCLWWTAIQITASLQPCRQKNRE